MDWQQLSPLRWRRATASLPRLLLAIGISTTLLLLLLWGLFAPAYHAASGNWYVSPQGDDGNSCSSGTAPCRRVQAALDKAAIGDTVNVAQGTYTDGAGTVAQITQDVTLQGGWNVSFTIRDPVAYPTVLDAQDGGPVIVISGPTSPDPISPKIEGFVLTNGNGTGVADCIASGAGGCGGGIFGSNTTPYILDNVITNNVATTSGEGFGGGIYLQGALPGGMIEGNTIVSNMATISSTTAISGWGGGICLYYIPALVYDNLIQDNVASASKGWGYGGGILLYRSAGQVISNVVAHNVASTIATSARSGYGGGISVHSWRGDEIPILDNELRDNVASQAGYGWGGGINIDSSNVLISGNRIIANIAGTSTDTGCGGGIHGRHASLTIRDNHILSNTATTAGMGYGGGCQLEYGDMVFEHNLVAGNTATEGTNAGYGGGINVLRCDGDDIVRYNTIRDNVASLGGMGCGGGLSVMYGSLTIEGNHVLNNQATGNDTSSSWGGGVRVDRATAVTFTNNIIAFNQARTGGGGVHVFGNDATPLTHATLIHNTLAENALVGAGEGIYVAQYATVSLTNNIVVSHSYGIFCDAAPSAATAHYNLFHGNYEADTAGAVTSSHAITGAPHFVAPAGGNFHIQPTSAALDSGTETCVNSDVDRDSRPIGDQVDVGADEMGVRGVELQWDQSAEIRPAGTIVYRHLLTNTGDYSDTFSLTVASLWPAAYAPETVTLAPSASRQVVVSLTIPLGINVLTAPLGVDVGVIHTAVLTATSGLNVNVFDSAIDATFINLFKTYLPVVTRSDW